MSDAANLITAENCSADGIDADQLRETVGRIMRSRRAVNGADSEDVRALAAAIVPGIIRENVPAEEVAGIALYRAARAVRNDVKRDRERQTGDVPAGDLTELDALAYGSTTAAVTSVARMPEPTDVLHADQVTPADAYVRALASLDDRDRDILAATLAANDGADVRALSPRHAHRKDLTKPAPKVAAVARMMGDEHAGRGRKAAALAAEQIGAASVFLARIDEHRDDVPAAFLTARLDSWGAAQRRAATRRAQVASRQTRTARASYLRGAVAALAAGPLSEAVSTAQVAGLPTSRIGAQAPAQPRQEPAYRITAPLLSWPAGRTARGWVALRSAHIGTGQNYAAGMSYESPDPDARRSNQETRPEVFEVAMIDGTIGRASSNSARMPLYVIASERSSENANRSAHGDTLARMMTRESVQAARDDMHEPGCSRRPGCGCVTAVDPARTERAKHRRAAADHAATELRHTPGKAQHITTTGPDGMSTRPVATLAETYAAMERDDARQAQRQAQGADAAPGELHGAALKAAETRIDQAARSAAASKAASTRKATGSRTRKPTRLADL